MADLKTAFVQFQKASPSSYAKEVKFHNLCFRMAGLRAMSKVTAHDQKVPWLAKQTRVSALFFFFFFPSSCSADARAQSQVAARASV